MAGRLWLKPGASVNGLSVAGAHILTAFAMTAARLGRDLTVTSGTDGEHRGPLDPHRRGDALDVRSLDLAPDVKTQVLALVMEELRRVSLRYGVGSAIVNTSGGRACWFFFGFLEAPGDLNEHFHVQLRRGRTLPQETTHGAV